MKARIFVSTCVPVHASTRKKHTGTQSFSKAHSEQQYRGLLLAGNRGQERMIYNEPQTQYYRFHDG